MEQQSLARLRMHLIEQRMKPPGLIWCLVRIRILGGCLKAMERMNASFWSAGYLSAFEYKQLIDWIRHAIHIHWQSKTCPTFEDMQHRICLLGIQLKTTFGSCEISSFLISCKKLINDLPASAV